MKWLNHLFGGPKNMAALTAGSKAPDFSLPALDGGKFSLQEALRQGPVVAAFFKVSCPVCQYAFPFFERLHKAFGSQKVTVVGISQDNTRDTAAFVKEFGVTFRMLLDDPNGYAVSNAYGLTNVPTLFLIGQDGQIEVSSVGWVKAEVEDVSRKLASAQQAAPPVLFKPGEDVRDFRAG
jgi:peroxiredoxin